MKTKNIVLLAFVLVFFTGCVKTYYNLNTPKEAKKVANFCINTAFQEYYKYNQGSGDCATDEYFGSLTKNKVSYTGMRNIDREITNYFAKNYVLTGKATKSYYEYDHRGNRYDQKTVETKLWIADGFFTVTTTSFPFGKLAVSLNNDYKLGSIQKNELKILANENNFNMVQYEINEFLGNQKQDAVRRRAYAEENAERAYKRDKETRKRTWNAVLGGINEGIKNWDNDLRKQRSINHDFMVPGAPKRWEDMTDAERKNYSENVKYTNTKYEKYKNKYNKSSSKGKTIIYSFSSSASASCQGCSISHKLVYYGADGRSKGKQFTSYVLKHYGEESPQLCKSSGKQCGSSSEVKEYLESLNAQGGRKIWENVGLYIQ